MKNFIFDGDPKLFHGSGIYVVENKTNHKKYVGSSKQIYFRLRKHLSDLRHNKHGNQHLQRSFNLGSNGVFVARVIERCEESLLAERERYWIETWETCKPSKGYNKTQVTDVRKNSLLLENKRKISQSLLGQKKVMKLDRVSGEVLCEYPSLVDAALDMVDNGCESQNLSHIRMRISMAARHVPTSTGKGRMAIRSTAYGYKWRIE